MYGLQSASTGGEPRQLAQVIDRSGVIAGGTADELGPRVCLAQKVKVVRVQCLWIRIRQEERLQRR